MTTLARIAIAALMALFASSCAFDINFGEGVKGNGQVVEASRTVTEDFDQVYAAEGLDVYVSQADEFSINIEADENIIDLIGTEIKDGRLKIHAIENIGRATKKVYVSLPEVTALKTSSGADLITETTINSSKITLDASSGSDIEATVNTADLIAEASSGADIKVSGRAESFFTDASSGAGVKARELLSVRCIAEASSGANIAVNVSESLTAEASSGGDISYTGDPSVQKKKSVSGSVHKY